MKFGGNGHAWYHMLQSLLFGSSLSVGVISAIFLLRYSIRRWRDSEMDFVFDAMM